MLLPQAEADRLRYTRAVAEWERSRPPGALAALHGSGSDYDSADDAGSAAGGHGQQRFQLMTHLDQPMVHIPHDQVYNQSRLLSTGLLIHRVIIVQGPITLARPLTQDEYMNLSAHPETIIHVPHNAAVQQVICAALAC